jgi:lysophospholipase L1-like esterase
MEPHLLSTILHLKPLRDILIIGVSSFLLYAVVDFAYGFIFPPKPYDSYKERLTSPAYKNEPYFSEEFLIESFIQPGEWTTREGTRLVFPKEFHGKYFNVDILNPTGLPYRRTINKVGEAKPVRTVLLLGGSTVYNSEVPDESTMASQLSRMLNDYSDHLFHVLNTGVTSANTTQDLERLELELRSGLRPDIVISFSGVNDALQGVYFGDPDGVMFSHATKPTLPQPKPNGFKSLVRESIPSWAYEAGKQIKGFLIPNRIYQALALRARYNKLRETPPHLLDEPAVYKLAERTAVKFEENVSGMHALGRQYGFRFLVFLQPHMYSGREYREMRDVEMTKKYDALRYPKIEVALSAAYQELRKAIDRLRDNDINAYDLSGLYDRKSENIFLDSHHVNSQGNMMIAAAVAMTIEPISPAKE